MMMTLSTVTAVSECQTSVHQTAQAPVSLTACLSMVDVAGSWDCVHQLTL